jgi:hypothetical protein
MLDDLRSCGLWELRGEQGAPAPLGKFFTAGAAAQQAHVLRAVYLADAKMALASMTKVLACRLDPGERVPV